MPLTADNPLNAVDVSVGVEKNAVRDFSIPSCPPRLLIVTLHWFRQAGVDDVAHIRLVDAHAEGYGGTDDLKWKRGKMYLLQMTWFVESVW